MAKSRTRKVIRNIVASNIDNIVSLICGLISSRLILRSFGSEYNGITQSIAQFISYISLMQSGIGGATIFALYKPLAENDMKEVSEIVKCTQDYMKKITMIFVAFILIFSFVYPTFIVRDFDWWFTASLVFIISIASFAQYYFGFTYQCLLNADQKGYILTYLATIERILNLIVAVVLIRLNSSIHIVELGASLVNVIPPLYVYFYVKKKYNLIYDIEVKEDKIPLKWNAAIHEVASFINNNTDVIVLSLFADIKEVSVYTVYHYVTFNIKKIVTNFTIGFGNAFGDMYAKNEIALMRENLGIYETIIYSMTTVFCSVSMVMLVPFAVLYAKGVNDISYSWPLFAVLMVISCAFNCYRVPYRSIVYSVGRFKETKNGAIFESIFHIIISVLGVKYFGLIGITFGSIFAMAFRTFQYAIYLSENIIDRSIWAFLARLFISFSIMGIVSLVSGFYMPAHIRTWPKWILYATITTLITGALVLLADLLFYRQDVEKLFKKLFGSLKIRKEET